jgi:hypothetical protein
MGDSSLDRIRTHKSLYISGIDMIGVRNVGSLVLVDALLAWGLLTGSLADSLTRLPAGVACCLVDGTSLNQRWLALMLTLKYGSHARRQTSADLHFHRRLFRRTMVGVMKLLVTKTLDG